MVTWQIFVLVLACVLLLLSALKIPEHPRVSFAWLGMFLWLLTEILGRAIR